jgi:lipopolysaccharide/colanic/teichoic acid biosynthesis glycosyltransferase
MVNNAEKLGSQVTTMNDKRVTRIGKLLRKFRIDEIPQLINILKGEMTFVGTRPEVQKYVDSYNEEMYATLLIRAGVTSKASILFKDEEKLLQKAINTDKTYIEEILTKKMNININSLNEFSFLSDIWIMLKTVLAIIKI